MKLVIDLNRTVYNKDIFEDYSSFLFWFPIILLHGIVVLNPLKNWEQRKTKELMEKYK